MHPYTNAAQSDASHTAFPLTVSLEPKKSKRFSHPQRPSLSNEYVNHRNAVLDRIGAFYGLAPKTCKYAVLRVLNGGSIAAWIRDAKCPQNSDKEQDDLRELVHTSNVVRTATDFCAASFSFDD